MRRMLLALPLLLTGCLSTIQNPVNDNDMAIVYSAYGSTLAVANAYRSLPLCRTGSVFSASNLCAKRSVIVQLQKADRQARIAMNTAQIFINNNPTLSASSLIGIAQAAVSAFQQIEIANGVAQ
jgi:hypothetical protein